jgi:hypothetical protein
LRLTAKILGGLLIAVGLIWMLQGVNILPGSFMTGQIVWAWRGLGTAVAGILLFLLPLALRKRR